MRNKIIVYCFIFKYSFIILFLRRSKNLCALHSLRCYGNTNSNQRTWQDTTKFREVSFPLSIGVIFSVKMEVYNKLVCKMALLMIHFNDLSIFKVTFENSFLGREMHRKWLFNFFSLPNLKFSVNFNIKWRPTQYTSPITKKVKKLQKGSKNTKNDFWRNGILWKNANHTKKWGFLVN